MSASTIHLRRLFLPSRTMGGYMIRLYLTRFGGLLIGLVAVLQMLDLLAVSDRILAAEGATSASLVSYVFLRAPQLINQFIPFTALLATLLTLAGLNQHSEIIIMKASGLSAHRILLPLGLACGIIAVVHMWFAETVVAPASAELDYWESQDFAVDLPDPPDVSNNVWIREGNSVIMAEAVSRSGSRVVLDKVSITQRDAKGLLINLTRANFALHAEGKWTLFEVRTFDVASHAVTTQESVEWTLGLAPERFFTLTINPEQTQFLSLVRSVKALDQEGVATFALKTALYQKLAIPLSTLLMPLLGAIAGFGVHRRGSLLARVVIGMALGFSYFVADNLMAAMGEFGVVPPIVAAFSPAALFMSVGFGLLFHTEE